MRAFRKLIVTGSCLAAGVAGAWDFQDRPEPPPVERRVEVQETYIELHTGPSAAYPVTQVIERGQELTVLKRRTGWVKVRGPRGQEGWISDATLERIIAAAAAENAAGGQ